MEQDRDNSYQQQDGEYFAEGFSFYAQKDAQAAELESRKIAYLESKMDYNQPESILRVYEKAIQDRVFKSPVGLVYLKGLQDYLLQQPLPEGTRIPPVPPYMTYVSEARENGSPARRRVQAPVKKEKKSSALPVSIILNILLVLAIMAMFVITLNAERPNILNYERVITDRYAAWEQELTQREQEIRQKERELIMETE